MVRRDIYREVSTIFPINSILYFDHVFPIISFEKRCLIYAISRKCLTQNT